MSEVIRAQLPDGSLAWYVGLPNATHRIESREGWLQFIADSDLDLTELRFANDADRPEFERTFGLVP
jgi:hypothetical protein